MVCKDTVSESMQETNLKNCFSGQFVALSCVCMNSLPSFLSSNFRQENKYAVEIELLNLFIFKKTALLTQIHKNPKQKQKAYVRSFLATFAGRMHYLLCRSSYTAYKSVLSWISENEAVPLLSITEN